MSEPYVVDGHASSVSAVTDFSILKKLVDADAKGSLFARKVCVECSLIDQPYDEVAELFRKISKSQINYDFEKVSAFTITTEEEWSHFAGLRPGQISVEAHIYSELKVEDVRFNEMKEALRKSNCLLIDISRLSDVNKTASAGGLH